MIILGVGCITLGVSILSDLLQDSMNFVGSLVLADLPGIDFHVVKPRLLLPGRTCGVGGSGPMTPQIPVTMTEESLFSANVCHSTPKTSLCVAASS